MTTQIFGSPQNMVSTINGKGMNFSSPFKFSDRVVIDGDNSLVATVLAFTFRSEFCQVEVAWMNSGAHYTAWLDNWRLSPAPEGAR